MQVQLGTILAPRSNKRMHTADDATEEEGARAAGPAEARADAMRHVMGYLGPRGLGHVACASRQTRRLTEDERVWKALCYSDFGILYRADRCVSYTTTVLRSLFPF